MDPEPEEDATNPHPTAEPQRRTICSKCDRPIPVCLCHVVPLHPIPTTTQVLILHHPHEANHKLSTTPILTKSLLYATAVTARRLHASLSPLLHNPPPTLYLFPSSPSSPALNISHLRRPERGKRFLLIAFDATWKHAKEMVKASEDFLSSFATRVCLEVDENASGGSIYDSDLILRKEPFAGCVSTMEAVARALRVLEPNGIEIEERLIGVLREMVRLQASFLKPMKPRPKLLKKKEKEKSESSDKGITLDANSSTCFIMPMFVNIDVWQRCIQDARASRGSGFSPVLEESNRREKEGRGSGCTSSTSISTGEDPDSALWC